MCHLIGTVEAGSGSLIDDHLLHCFFAHNVKYIFQREISNECFAGILVQCAVTDQLIQQAADGSSVLRLQYHTVK